MNLNVGVIDVGAGNVGAIVSRLAELDVHYILIDQPTAMEFSHIILPGVGNFDDFMKRLERKDLHEFIVARSLINTKILGICVGMHALAFDSEEGQQKGLGLIPGSVVKINSSLPLPHMGWNSIQIQDYNSIVDGLDCNVGFYYLHNYKFLPKDDTEVIVYSQYGQTIAGVVKKGNIYGVQFHPEKSHENGLLLFRNFLEL